MKDINELRIINSLGVHTNMYPCTKEEAEQNACGIIDRSSGKYYLYSHEELQLNILVSMVRSLNTIKFIMSAWAILTIIGTILLALMLL
ncbi:MAG: hypothetical protein PHW34_07720 [Hespellia sp.]|nr:hypothetical protein [Hespellia sp.]